MPETLSKINEEIRKGKTVVLGPEQFKKEKDNKNNNNAEKIPDAVTTCTFGPMASTGLAGKAAKMNSMVLYDSTYGNTKAIAQAIAIELGQDAREASISSFDIKMLKGIELLIVGSPIIGWKPTEKISGFLAGLSNEALSDKKAAAFDTRIKTYLSGDAAKKIIKEMQRASAQVIAEPAVFYVKSTEGPLLDGEIERARSWARKIKEAAF